VIGVIKFSALMRYENIHGHMNVLGHPYPSFVCNIVFSTNFRCKGESIHVVCLLEAHPVSCSMASGIVIAIL
jgi:hypothetical protein